MVEMKTVYQVQGKLPKDFVGQISYTVCLDETYEELDIEFSFGPRHFSPEDITPGLKQRLLDYCKEAYDLTLSSPEELEDAIYGQMKTEIHTLAMLNDEFIGCIHRQLTTRHMHFTREEATEGCIPQASIEGVLKVTILAFSVLLDSTDYTLTVRVR
ncbi:DUF6669 family protein [Lacrimispora sp.]|uniref:DUF6669 family protein n=1 Tax=Lacrimispora sp. TaxID=2719234 RepID=UPI0028AF49AD|nr:DUF6669 family protein [Lacrimispora sp.]